ncbi:CGLAU_01105 family protein [Corynebacterium sp.]|uniref:CGLAU_01105 family protein n=1 Tax=Corynebacterium sp. TaxID=1720 RepID=UPI0026DA7BA2|nr:CGLAU_01105 family protein [Corynebacterium sp.]MDO5031912.1 CGLAU_01105 family protein [Corynebacterium sp.]
MSVFDSIKNAGASALDVAKDFGDRFKEERQNQAQSAQADRIVRNNGGAEKEESLLDRISATAKNLGDSVSAAAEGTRKSEAFDKARADFNSAVAESREGMQEAVNSAKERANQRKEGAESPQGTTAAQTPQAPNPYQPKAEEAPIIDGEVVSEDTQAADTQAGSAQAEGAQHESADKDN